MCQDDGKGGLSLGGGGLAVLTVLAVLENTLPSFCVSYKMQHDEATVAVLTVLAVVAVLVVTATPHKTQPPFFRHPECESISEQCPTDGVWRIWQGSVSRHGLLETVYPLREHLNNVQLMVSGEYCEGVFSLGSG